VEEGHKINDMPVKEKCISRMRRGVSGMYGRDCDRKRETLGGKAGGKRKRGGRSKKNKPEINLKKKPVGRSQEKSRKLGTWYSKKKKEKETQRGGT